MWTHQFSKTIIGISLALSLATVSEFTPPISEAEAAQEVLPVKAIVITAVVTSYSSEPEQTDSTPEITASNKQVRDGFAACPYRYPFGTGIVIEGKRYVCEDRMSRKFPDRFDIWSPSKEAAIEWGKRITTITIEQ